MQTNRYSSSDYSDDAGVSRRTHYSMVAVALVIGLVTGGVVGWGLMKRQMDTFRLHRDLNGMANAATSLTLIEHARREQVQKYQEDLLTAYVQDAYESASTVKTAPIRIKNLPDSFTRADAYAQEHKLTSLASQLTAVRQRLDAMQRR